MINKGDPANRHPGHILRQISDDEEAGFFIALKNPGVHCIKDAGNTSPPDHRISHTAYCAYLCGAYRIVGI